MGNLDAWYDHLEVERLMELVRAEVRGERLSKGEVRAAERDVAKARTRDSVRVLAKRAGGSTGSCGSWPTRRSSCPSRTRPAGHGVGARPSGSSRSSCSRTGGRSAPSTIPLEEYRYVHTARKVVGVGSVGTRCYILLLRRPRRPATRCSSR